MKAVIGLLLMFAVACASTPAAKTEYLLRYDVPISEDLPSGTPRIGLRRVLVAAYLNQPGLAVETAENEVRPAQSHLWAEPLGKGLTLFLRAAIASGLDEEVGMVTRSVPQWEQSVDVFVEQLHGTMSGNAVLVANFQIASGAGSVPTEYRFSRSIPLESEGYAALVRAEKQLVAQLAAAIVAALTSTR